MLAGSEQLMIIQNIDYAGVIITL